MERCLACEAAVSSGMSSRNAHPHAALYRPYVDEPRFGGVQFEKGYRPTAKFGAIQSVDKDGVCVTGRAAHDALASEALLQGSTKKDAR
jgi:hypothetical protein